VSDDPCRRLPVAAAPGRLHRVGTRPPSRCRLAEAASVRRAPGSLSPLSSHLHRLETAVPERERASV
jgi:hypothetical protein